MTVCRVSKGNSVLISDVPLSSLPLKFYVFTCCLCSRTPTKALLLSACVKIMMHCQPPDPELVDQVVAVFRR